jgi:hypothetical protein
MADSNKCYWKCEFEANDGSTVCKTIFAKSTRGAFKHSFEMGVRIGMTPKYETLRNATAQDVKEFKKMIKERTSAH